MDEQTAGRLLLSIEQNSLVVLCGAGLSLALPSRVPLARELAVHWCEQYESTTGIAVPAAARENLEGLAEYFLSKAELIRALWLVDWSLFIRDPNAGHFALADFLACKAVHAVITTNVDTLVELAATQLGEPFFQSSLDGVQANRPSAHNPYFENTWVRAEGSGTYRLDRSASHGSVSGRQR